MARYLVRNSEDQLRHSRGETGIEQRAQHLDGGARRFLGGLENDGAAGRNRSAELAAGVGDREIPGREGRHGTDGLLDDDGARARGADQNAAIRPAALLSVELEEVRGDQRLDARLRDRLTFLQRRDPGDVVHALANQVGRAFENLGALLGGRALPHTISPVRRFEGAVEIGGIRERQRAQDGSIGRIDDGMGAALAGSDPFAVDV